MTERREITLDIVAIDSLATLDFVQKHTQTPLSFVKKYDIISVDELKERLSQDVKTALMNIRPWRALFIDNEYVPETESFWFRYDFEQ